MNPVLFALAIAVDAPGPKEAKKEPPALVGVWAAEAAVKDGKPDNPPPGTTWEFTADGKSVLRIGGGGDTREGTYKADASKDPAEVDVSVGPKGDPLKGLFAVDGDTLTLCFFTDSDERPKKIETASGSKAIVVTLKRVKK